MTNDDKALVERLRDNDRNIYLPLLGEAADRIEALSAEIERLNINGIHTCHDQCARPLCVAWREIEHLKDVYSSATECFLEADAKNERLRAVVDLLLQHDASTFFGPDGEKSKRASYRGVIRKAKKVYAELGEMK